MNTLYKHLVSRGCNPLHYNVVLDEENNTATFFLYSATGKLTGYHAYKPGAPKTRDGKGFNPKDLRYYTHAVDGELCFFGAETLKHAGPLYLVEGVFDAVKLHSLGLPCLAVLGNNPKPLRAFLKALNRPVVGVLDNDEAGRKLAAFCDKVYVCETKDPGEMTLGELENFLGV